MSNMFKRVRTSLVKSMMDMCKKFGLTGFGVEDFEDGSVMVITENFSHSDRKKYVRIITVEIKETVKEIK